MFDYSVFDFILDATLVIDDAGKVVYCNEVAASLCQTSVRRMLSKANLADYLKFDEPGLLPFTENSPGRISPSTLIETGFRLLKVEKVGKVQLTIRPTTANHWVLFLHDVSLEETLAAKYRGELQKTEEYARNLEKLVEARTQELRHVNLSLKAILDSLGQGFFTFNAQGDCGGTFTKACENILEGAPGGRKAWEVLGLKGEEVDQFKKWMDTLFSEPLPFDDLKTLGPSLFAHSAGHRIELEFYPIRREQGEIAEVVVVATDKTTEHQAQKALESERQSAAMLLKFLKNRDQFHSFIASVFASMDSLFQLAAKPTDLKETLNELFRILHTIEGEAGVFSLQDLRFASRECQNLIEPFMSADLWPENRRSEFRAELKKMRESFSGFLQSHEEIFGMARAKSQGRTLEVPYDSLQQLFAELGSLAEAQKVGEKYREIFFKVEIGAQLTYFDGLVQTVAERLGKKVHPLVISGGEFRVFPEPFQKFFSSLVHAFRNAVDHGLEDPTEREWAGKSEAGRIEVRITPESGGFRMTIADDGKGIDPAIIRNKLKEKFPDRDFTAQSDEEVIQNVALPGFSSRDGVGEFSGRGVGLDALREEVLRLSGDFRLKSKVSEGTTLQIFIPEVSSGLARSA